MLGEWTGRLPELAAQFQDASPFPLVVIDGFLQADVADGLLCEFPAIDAMGRSHDYIFGKKRESPELAGAGPTSRQFQQFLLSADFAGVLGRLTGRELFLDPSFHGGGFHQGGDGSFLDTHVDFNIHPHHDDWLRVLNVLIYLNRDWPPSFGGELLVRRHPTDPPRSITPLFNRGVIMLTGAHSYHGYRRMSLPPGRTRKSIAAYAYEQIQAGSQPVRTTSWAPENAGPVKRILGKHWSGIASLWPKPRRGS